MFELSIYSGFIGKLIFIVYVRTNTMWVYVEMARLPQWLLPSGFPFLPKVKRAVDPQQSVSLNFADLCHSPMRFEASLWRFHDPCSCAAFCAQDSIQLFGAGCRLKFGGPTPFEVIVQS